MAVLDAVRSLRKRGYVKQTGDEPSEYQLAVMDALATKHVYAGTVDPAVKAKRRARNKVARASRRVNRGRS